MNWFHLLAVHGTLRSLLQHHNLKATILRCSALFMVQLSHPYMTTEKTLALTIWIFIIKEMSLLFNILFRFIITFLPRSKCLKFHGCSHHPQGFLETKKIKSITASTFPPSICHEVMGPDAMIFTF